MSWFLVDDDFHGNEKVLDLLEHPLGLAAMGLWTFCGSWSRRHRKAGFVPHSTVRSAGRPESNLHVGRVLRTFSDACGQPRTRPDTSELAAVLVDAKLWIAVDGGYQFHDWDDIYKTEDKAAERKKKDADRKRAKRALERLQSDVGDVQRMSADCPRTRGEGDGTDGSGYKLAVRDQLGSGLVMLCGGGRAVRS